MMKLYRKSTVHPSPPPPPTPQQPPSTDPLAILPAAILTLAVALTATDREVLAYLLSCSSASSPASTTIIGKQGFNKQVKGGDHAAAFNCDCFSCYTSYWARWDSSPNRQLIHEIIDAYEDQAPAKNRGSSTSNNKNRGGRRERKKKAMDGRDSPEADLVSDMSFDLHLPEPAEHGGESEGSGGGEEEKGSVRKLVSFIGEKVWSFWG